MHTLKEKHVGYGFDAETSKIKRARHDRNGTHSKMEFTQVEKPHLLTSYEVFITLQSNETAHAFRRWC